MNPTVRTLQNERIRHAPHAGLSLHAGSPADDLAGLPPEDPRAAGELYRRHVFAVRGLCHRYVRDASIAEDLVQETFAKAIGHIARFRPGERVWPWLSTIARNVCIDELRLRRATPFSSIARDGGPFEEPAPPASRDVTAEEALLREERSRMRAELYRGMGALSLREQRILWLHSVEEWPYADIARIDRSTVDTVRNIAWRARRTARATIEAVRRSEEASPSDTSE